LEAGIKGDRGFRGFQALVGLRYAQPDARSATLLARSYPLTKGASASVAPRRF